MAYYNRKKQRIVDIEHRDLGQLFDVHGRRIAHSVKANLVTGQVWAFVSDHEHGGVALNEAKDDTIIRDVYWPAPLTFVPRKDEDDPSHVCSHAEGCGLPAEKGDDPHCR